MTNEQTLQLILKAIEKHPNDKGAYADLVTLSKIESNSADYVRSAKKILSQNMNKDMLETMRAIDIRLGRESFMEFLNAIEIDREQSSVFWQRRAKILENKHKIASTINRFMQTPTEQDYFLCMSFPPGLGKSALLSFISAYVMGKNHNSRNFYVGYSSKLPEMTYNRVKGIIDPAGEYNFMDIFYDFPMHTINFDNKALDIRIDSKGISEANARKNDPIFSYISIDGSITGVTRASGNEKGFGYAMVDDLVEDNKAADSFKNMQTLYETYNSKILTRMLGDYTKVIAVGTRWSFFDILSRLEREYANDTRYTFLRFPVENDNGESNFDFGISGEGYSKAAIKQKRKELDPASFNCLYMQIPTHKTGRLFEIESLNLYNGVLPDEEPDQIVATCDVAYGGKDSLSMPCAYVYGEDVYIHDVVFTKEDREKSQPQVVGLISKNKIQLAQFEANNGGDQYADKVSEMLEIENVKCLVTSKRASTKMSKETRIAQYAPDIRKWHFLSIDNRSVQYQKFIDEVCNFTVEGNNAHDDAPDSCGQLADFIFNRKAARKTQVTVGKRLF